MNRLHRTASWLGLTSAIPFAVLLISGPLQIHKVSDDAKLVALVSAGLLAVSSLVLLAAALVRGRTPTP